MTKEQEEAIEYLEQEVIVYENNKEINRIIGGEAGERVHEINKTVLNMLKEKDIEIKSIEKSLHDEIIENYNKQNLLKEKIEKRNKQIDLMAKYLNMIDIDMTDICRSRIINPKLCNEEHSNCKECIKQYFERECEDE